jgi:hypothetical protein
MDNVQKSISILIFYMVIMWKNISNYKKEISHFGESSVPLAFQ